MNSFESKDDGKFHREKKETELTRRIFWKSEILFEKNLSSKDYTASIQGVVSGFDHRTPFNQLSLGVRNEVHRKSKGFIHG